jgi:protein subunit release factor A
MLAKHKKTCFDRIQATRTVHDALWDTLNAGKAHPKAENVNRVQKNLEVNYERYRKAATALENFQLTAAHIRRFLATCDDPEKRARATAQLADVERRINDIKEGIQKFEKWIEDDERILKEE